MGYEEKIAELEEEIRKTQYNKATQHHIGLVKAKIARLREEQEKEQQKASARGGDGYSVPKTGDATVIMLGFPSVGKSTLLNALTNAESDVAPYEFTTLDVIPGMMELNGAQIQVLDVPGIVQGAASGKGRGKEVLAVLRNADLVLYIIDATRTEHLPVLKKEVYDAGLRVNQEFPMVKVVKKEKGGINVIPTTKLSHTDKETLKDVAAELGFLNADIIVREDITVDRFIDALEANKAYMPALTILNKVDLVGAKAGNIAKETGADILISAKEDENLEELEELIWENLGLIRIYMKEPGKDADMEEPLVLDKESTIEDACNKLHRDFKNRFKFARVTGPSAKHDGQKVALTHELKDQDVLELHLR